jgi:hypothetical protein
VDLQTNRLPYSRYAPSANTSGYRFDDYGAIAPFEVSPRTGRALVTEFSLTAHGWDDWEKDLPLTYAFSFCHPKLPELPPVVVDGGAAATDVEAANRYFADGAGGGGSGASSSGEEMLPEC